MKRPMIGLTLDAEPAGGWSALPWYALRQNYCTILAKVGAIPVCLPHEPELAFEYIERLEGLVVTGGAFDIDPLLWGAQERHASVTTKDQRTGFERAIVQAALERDLPILGICGGEQLLAVLLGATLIQHIPDEVAGALAHEQPNPRTEPGHSVRLVPGTRLHELAQTDHLSVNSAHHQAVKTVPTDIVVNAFAGDGVIEGIEDPHRRFCLGVQWHPEYDLSPVDRALFTALVDHAAGRA